jgi:hypothetical protein
MEWEGARRKVRNRFVPGQNGFLPPPNIDKMAQVMITSCLSLIEPETCLA